MMLFSCCRKGGEAFRRPALVDVHPTCNGDDDDSLTDGLSSSFGSSQESWLERTCSLLRRNDVQELEVDPDENVIDEEDLLLISDAMKDCKRVTRLILRNVETAYDGSPLLLDSLLDETNSITTVFLEDSGEEAVISVARKLAQETTGVTALHLKGNVVCPVGAGAIGDMLKQNKSITHVSICHNGITEEGMAAIALGLRYNRTLKSLDLLGNLINDVSMSKLCNSLAYNESIEFLCLDFNAFDCVGVQAIGSMLTRNNSLQELHLFGNRIDARGAECLASALYFNRSLQKLVLSFNCIGNEGSIALAKALTVNTTLTELSVQSNHLGREGLLVLGQLLPDMKGLEKLIVGDVFDTVGAEALVQGLERNTRLVELHMESPAFDDLSGVESRLDFLLRSNKSGRSLLYARDHFSPSLWATALAKAGEHASPTGCPDVMYAIVRERPDLFQSRR